MLEYDPDVLKKLANRYHNLGRIIPLFLAIIGFLYGAQQGSFLYFGTTLDFHMPEYLLCIVCGTICGGLALLIGFFIKLHCRFKTQSALYMLEMEKK